MRRSSRNVTPCLVFVLCFPLAACVWSQPPPTTPERTAYAGLPLTDALLDLESRGLKILFTSQVVRPGMRVQEEPSATTPREILDEILEPHGLEVRPGPGGILVVVERPPSAAGLRGQVSDRYGARRLAGVQVLVLDSEHRTVSGEDGGFEILGLSPGTYTLEARIPGFVVQQLPEVTVAPGRVTGVTFELVPAPVPLDEIVVTPSTIHLLRADPVPALSLGRDEIVALPHLGDDLFRTFTLFPGISGNEFSAQFHIRGGRSDEVLVMLDQLELFEPYHLRDFNSALSIIAPQAIQEVELTTGGFPARFGDRMGGVLDMTTVATVEGGRTHLGVAVLSTQAGSSGSFADERGEWTAVGRFGNLQLLSSYLERDERPEFWDLFGKLAYRLSSRHRLGTRWLRADDRLDFGLAEEGAVETANTSYGSSYLWITHQALLSSELFVDSVVSRGRIDRDRFWDEREIEGEEQFDLSDRRVLDVAGIKQDWNYQHAGGRSYWRWGFDLRRFDSDYDYLNQRELDDSFDAIRAVPRTGVTLFQAELEGDQYSGYLSDRVRWRDGLTLELGARYDEHTATGDRDFSPRFNLVAALGEATTLRAAWGYYVQTQRLYELRIEDGETDFFSSELTEQSILGLEHAFGKGTMLQVTLYHRAVDDPRARYENVIEPVTPFPEIEPDRVLIEPESSLARGVEIFVRGARGDRLEWWLSYTWSEVEDRVDGRDVPRGIDQPHTFNADLSYRIGDHWTINLAFRYHTGWPTTGITAGFEENDEGELEAIPIFGPIYGERLSDYHRLDVRISRQWRLKRGELSFFIDLQNVYDRKNLAGLDVDLEFGEDESGDVVLMPVEEVWGGFLPSFGIDWKF